MRILLQRVKEAKVLIDNVTHSEIGTGLLIFLGIEQEDCLEDIQWLVKKICQIRIFADNQNRMNLDIREVFGDILVVSQFTLFASTKKGNRPGFSKAAEPNKAALNYQLFIDEINKFLQKEVKTGVFGSDMDIYLINAGPVTIFMDSKNKE